MAPLIDEPDDVQLEAELRYVPPTKDELRRRNVRRWFSFSLFSRVDAPPGYHALNALRLLAIVGVLAAVMPTVAHLTDGVQVSGMIHPSICTWSIGIAGSFLVGQIIGTSVWKVIGPTARQAARGFIIGFQKVMPWLALAALVGVLVLVVIARARR